MVYGSNYGTTSFVADVEPEVYDESMEIMDIGMQIMEECSEDWNNMMKAVASVELGYVVENQQEMIYEAVDIKAWGEKVISWFKNILKKILGMLQTAKAKFMSWASKDATFLNKYEDRIKEGSNKIPSGFSFKGYEFDDLAGKVSNIQSAMDKATGKYTKITTMSTALSSKMTDYSNGALDVDKTVNNYSDSEKVAEFNDEIRGVLAGSDMVTNGEFRKELFKLFHGSSSKVSINSGSQSLSSSYIIDTIKNAKTAVKTVEDQKTATTKTINNAISKINDSLKTAKDSNDKVGIARYNTGVTVLKKAATDVATYCTMLTSALKDENRQAKAVAVKFVSYAGYKGKLNESYATQSYGSVFDEAFANI